MCGGNSDPYPLTGDELGLSPLVRGKPRQPLDRPFFQGSIPACAGETKTLHIKGDMDQVYPRLCGGNRNSTDDKNQRAGLSPLVRGKRQGANVTRSPAGSIPACAGETLFVFSSFFRFWVYPRLCGGNAWNRIEMAGMSGLSPLVRGKPSPRWRGKRRPGSIPACAGETFLC